MCLLFFNFPFEFHKNFKYYTKTFNLQALHIKFYNINSLLFINYKIITSSTNIYRFVITL